MTVPRSTEKIAKTINGKSIRLEKNDLTSLPVDAVVFYAREDLALGAGFGTAIHSRGGAAIKQELGRIGSVGMGEAVVTTAGNLPARYLIHACGPKFHEPDLEGKLRNCMASALAAAEAHGVKRVAFPPMGAGFYGIPLDLCATVMVEVAAQFLHQESTLEEVVICVIDDRELRAFKPKLEAL
jgi:O-acetyl-ADP-ribose deacetylase